MVLAANRAEVAAKRHPSFSPAVKRRWAKIAQIYRSLAEELKHKYRREFYGMD